MIALLVRPEILALTAFLTVAGSLFCWWLKKLGDENKCTKSVKKRAVLCVGTAHTKGVSREALKLIQAKRIHQRGE